MRRGWGVLLLVIGVMAVTWSIPAAWASVAVEARLVRGGLDLDFGTLPAGEASRTEELELTLTSTGTSQYRLYQEFLGSLVNERGERLPEGKLVMQISRGLTGTRGAEGILPVSETSQELFVSDAAGSSDALLVAYAIQPSPDVQAGTYRGVLRFTTESLDTGAINTQTVNVQVVIPPGLGLEPDSPDSLRIELHDTEPGARSQIQEVGFRIRNNTGGSTQVTHELVEPLATTAGEALPPEALTFAVRTAQEGESWRTASVHPDVVLSDERGELRDIWLTYAVEIPVDQPAGRYRGVIRVGLTSLGTSATHELLVPVELVVSEVFTMSVKPVDSSEGRLHFGPPSAGGEPDEQRIVVEIRTNLGRPYQVLAGLDHPLVLETGETLPADSLVWSIPQAEHGTALIAARTPVNVGYEPVYRSDASGSSDSFVVNYRLTAPADAKSGMYSGKLHFTITVF